MAFKIGANIALDGEKEFRDAVAAMNSNLKVMQSEMKALTSGFDANNKSVEQAAARQKNLTQQYEQQQEKVEQLEAALQKATEEFGAGSKQAQNWEIQLNNAKAALNGTKKELDSTNKELAELKKQETGIGKLKTAFKEMKEKISEAEEKTKKLREAMSKIGDAAKAGLAAGATAVAAVGAAAVKAGKEIWSMAQEVAEAGDEVEKNSQKVGMSYEAYQKWNYAMKISGTDMQSCTNGLKTLTNSFDDAISGSDKAREKFDRLGLSVDAMNGMSREQVFSTVVNALQNVTDETEKAALANDLFGKSGQNLIPMFNLTNEELANLMQQAEDYGMVMSDDAVKASAAFQDSMTKLKGTATGLKNMFVGELLPGITGITAGLTEILHGDAQAGIERISGAVGELVDKISEMLPKAMELGGSILTAIVNSIAANLPRLLSVGGTIIVQLGSAIVQNAGTIASAAVECVRVLADGMTNKENLNAIVAAAVEVIKVLSTGLIEMLPELTEAGIELLLGLIAGLADSGTLSIILESGIKAAGELVQGLIRCVPDLLDAGWQLIKGLWQGISNAAGWLWEQIKGIGGQLVKTIKSIFGIKSPSTVMRDEIGANLMRGIAKGITDYAPEAEKAMRDATAGLTASAEMEYKINAVYEQIAATQRQPAAVTYTTAGAAVGSSVPLDVVIGLLERIADKDDSTAVFTPDGQFAGWIDRQMGDRVRLARRFV